MASLIIPVILGKNLKHPGVSTFVAFFVLFVNHQFYIQVMLIYRHRYLPKNDLKKQEYFINGIYFGKVKNP